MPWSSNATFLVNITCGGHRWLRASTSRCAASGRCGTSNRGCIGARWRPTCSVRHLGLDLVPPTVLRDGPFGEGSVQWFVDVDHRQHYFTIHEERPDLHDTLRAVALFDLVANNTDRKSGHVLIDGDDHIWGIDHGLCFSADFKLRTVVWEFGGEPIDPALIDDGRSRWSSEFRWRSPPCSPTTRSTALQERAEWVAANAAFPVDVSGRRYPWPIV